MTTHSLIGFLIFLGILVLVDLYAYMGICTAIASWGQIARQWVKLIYWTISIGMLLMLCFGAFRFQELRSSHNHAFAFSVIGVFILLLLPKLVIVVFHGVEDMLQAICWGWSRMAPGAAPSTGAGVGRIRFISQLGLALAAIPFGSVLHGLTKGRRNFNVSHVPIVSKKLPTAFDGLRIVQISDLHLGSFSVGSDIVQRGIDLINAEDPDLILFTGDLVNDYADEAEPWLEQLKGLKARMGKYSILGNHDYSDYASWPNLREKRMNMEKLMGHHRTLGFRLLLDEHLPIGIPGQGPGGDTFTLIGVQNWGVRFQQYGNLKKAIAGTDDSKFRLLMSHDPTHWEAQVQETGIDLMLSGHTHGAQFGITIAGRTYSPAQWVYKQWAGHYEQDGMQLYVNRGFGFIGFPGRVGMPPEITVIELRRA